jgi:hypothetical protein
MSFIQKIFLKKKACKLSRKKIFFFEYSNT